jgi:hypothetical protein
MSPRTRRRRWSPAHAQAHSALARRRRTCSGGAATATSCVQRPSFCQQLVRLDLIDAFHLRLYPYVVGEGRRLFDGVGRCRSLDLTPSMTLSEGTLESAYRRRFQLSTL